MSGGSSRGLSRHSRVPVVGSLALLLALTLAGCFGGPGPHEYDLVNTAANELQVTDAGTVLFENHYGQMRRMDGPGPGVEFFVATDDASAAQTIVNAAVRNGWDGSGDHGASTMKNGYHYQLAVRPWPARAPAQMSDGKTHTWNRAGLLVSIDQS